MEFEWDTGNRDKNWVLHGVTNEEIEECFFNAALQFDDVKHSQKELRRILLGITDQRRLLTVIYTMREDRVRVISAGPMSGKERNLYEAKQQEENPSFSK